MVYDFHMIRKRETSLPPRKQATSRDYRRAKYDSSRTRLGRSAAVAARYDVAIGTTFCGNV